MEDLELCITLKQHTPLIHFQHDQEGATLRASEVKPKLDRFIKNQLKQIRPDLYNEYEKLTTSNPHIQRSNRSPYQLFIKQDDSVSVDEYVLASYIPRGRMQDYRKEGYKVLNRTPYFADDKYVRDNNLSEGKLGIMINQNQSLNLMIRFFYSGWKELFKKIIPLFFVTTNFGSRQSKGFGCFFPANMNQQEVESILFPFFPIVYRCILVRNQSKEIYFEKVFMEIDTIYKKIKSGGQRIDSELRKYFNNMRPVIEWEKPVIQKKIAKISGQRINIRPQLGSPKFVRALLGLPELYEYPRHGKLKVLVKNKDIERYASPVLFKVFDNCIYIAANPGEYSKEMLGKTFGFEFRSEGKSYGEETLDTPDNFDIVDFLDKTMKKQALWQKL